MAIHCFSAAFGLKVACGDEHEGLVVSEGLSGDDGVDGKPGKLGNGMTL